MHFIVFFPEKKSVDLLESDYLMMGEFQDLTAEDWAEMPKERSCPVEALFGDEICHAVILQAVPEVDAGVSDQMRILRALVAQKNYKETHLLKKLNARVRRCRSRFPPWEVSHSLQSSP